MAKGQATARKIAKAPRVSLTLPDHANRLKAATTRCDGALRELFDAMTDHHVATLDALTAMASARGMGK